MFSASFSYAAGDVATDFATEIQEGCLQTDGKVNRPVRTGGGGVRHVLSIAELDMIEIGGKLLLKERNVKSSLVSSLRQKIEEREILRRDLSAPFL